MEKQRIIIIGANEFQEPLIRRCRDEGFETHVFAWEKGAVAKQHADFFYPVSIVEKEEILKEAGKIRPAAVASIASDLAEVTVNYLAGHLKLPGNPPETAILAVNKCKMRKAFRAAGLPTPPFMSIRKSSGDREWADGIREIGFPLIIKPADRSGSRAVCRIDSEEEAREKLPAALRDALSASFAGEAIAEGCIEGKEYSCECISSHGRHRLLQVTAKYTTGAPHYIETGHLEPSGLDAKKLAEVEAVVFRALDALHVRSGASHTELRISDEGKIGLIESGARMGGDCIGSDLVPLTTGYDYIKMVLDTALGREPDFTRLPHRGAALIRFLMNGEDRARFARLSASRPALFVRSFMSGSPLPEIPRDSGSRHGFYILAGDHPEELRNYLEEGYL